MTRDVEERERRVRAVVKAAQHLSEADGALVDELVATTGLSRAGVLLGLREYLETCPSDAEVASLVASAVDAPRVHVILSANVFVAALRAVALACAASANVTVRPSRREPAFARALLSALPSGMVQRAEDLRPEDVIEGEIHVYGRDETIASVRRAARPGVRVRGHGAGMGIAWVGARNRLDSFATALSRDVVVFDQRGCLSPRIALVHGGPERASAFAAELHDRLSSWQTVQGVPRGALDAAEEEQRARYIETMTIAGEVLATGDHVVAVAPPGAPLVVPPPGRHVHIAPIATIEEAARLLAPLAKAIVAVAIEDDDAAARIVPPHARRSSFGRMQKPPFDGPVDRRPDFAS